MSRRGSIGLRPTSDTAQPPRWPHAGGVPAGSDAQRRHPCRPPPGSTWPPRRRRGRARPGGPRGQRPARPDAGLAAPEPIAAALATSAAYPDPAPARAAIAARHRPPADEVLLTAGAAEAFVLLAQALRDARRPVVVHPQFTEPEAALRAAGHQVDRVLLTAGPLPAGSRPGPRRRRPGLSSAIRPIPPRCCTRPAVLRRLARPGRVLVVDEAFADTTMAPGSPVSPSRWPAAATCPAWSWSAASPRPGGWPACGSATCSARRHLVARLAAVQPLWAVSTPALAAAAGLRRAPRAVAAERADRRAARRRPGLPGRPARPNCPASRRRAPRRARSCWCGRRWRRGSGWRCGTAAMRSGAATPFPAWAPTGCGWRYGTLPPPTRSSRCWRDSGGEA